MTREARNDLFQTTFIELHQEAPTELLRSLRSRLEHIRANNPQSAQTAEACLQGLEPENSTLLHVLTAAYLINGGVMLKHPAMDSEAEGETTEAEDRRRGLTLESLRKNSVAFQNHIKASKHQKQQPSTPGETNYPLIKNGSG
jgi:hypothetical protein